MLCAQRTLPAPRLAARDEPAVAGRGAPPAAGHPPWAAPQCRPQPSAPPCVEGSFPSACPLPLE